MEYLVILIEMCEQKMQTIKTNEKNNQRSTIKIFDTFFKYLLCEIFLLSIPLVLRIFIDYSTLDSRTISAIMLLFIFSITFVFITILIYISPFIFQILKHKSMNKNDYLAIDNEQANPTKRSYKIRRILLLLFSISGILTLIAYLTFLIVIIIIS